MSASKCSKWPNKVGMRSEYTSSFKKQFLLFDGENTVDGVYNSNFLFTVNYTVTVTLILNYSKTITKLIVWVNTSYNFLVDKRFLAPNKISYCLNNVN